MADPKDAVLIGQIMLSVCVPSITVEDNGTHTLHFPSEPHFKVEGLTAQQAVDLHRFIPIIARAAIASGLVAAQKNIEDFIRQAQNG